MKRINFFMAFTAAAAMLFGAFTPANAGEVVVYSSNQPEMMDMLAKDFEQKSGHKVTVVRMGTGEAMKRIDAEKENPLGDVFASGDVAVLDNAKANFMAYKSKEAAVLPADYADKDSKWTSSNVHLMVIMVNTDLVKPEDMPKSWKDLLDPKWKGKVVMANPQKSGSAYAQLYGLHKLVGDAGLAKLVDNLKIVDSSSLVYKGVAAGEFPCSITMEYAAYRYIAGGQKNIQIVYPAEGAIAAPEAVAVIDKCKNTEAAKQFVDYLLSADVENAIFQKYYRRPARPDAVKIEGLPALREIKLMPGIDLLEANRMKSDLLGKWKKLVLDK